MISTLRIASNYLAAITDPSKAPPKAPVKKEKSEEGPDTLVKAFTKSFLAHKVGSQVSSRLRAELLKAYRFLKGGDSFPGLPEAIEKAFDAVKNVTFNLDPKKWKVKPNEEVQAGMVFNAFWSIFTHELHGKMVGSLTTPTPVLEKLYNQMHAESMPYQAEAIYKKDIDKARNAFRSLPIPTIYAERAPIVRGPKKVPAKEKPGEETPSVKKKPTEEAPKALTKSQVDRVEKLYKALDKADWKDIKSFRNVLEGSKLTHLRKLKWGVTTLKVKDVIDALVKTKDPEAALKQMEEMWVNVLKPPMKNLAPKKKPVPGKK